MAVGITEDTEKLMLSAGTTLVLVIRVVMLIAQYTFLRREVMKMEMVQRLNRSNQCYRP